jgi:hypothetical protein
VSEPKEYSIVDASKIFARWVIVDPRDISRRMEMDDANGFALRLFELTDENARLKAEVERLNAECNGLIKGAESDIAYYKAEVERLTKAGDVMADWLDNQGNYGGLTDGWHAAKEGKQP